MTKGIVMEIRERDSIVLTDTGAFVRVKNNGATFAVGAEIVLPAARRALPRRMVWAAGTAAASLLLVAFLFAMIPGLLSPASVPADRSVAYVTIDINPSIEFGIDKSETVVVVRELNEDAEKLAHDLPLEGKPLDLAVRLYMERAESALLKDRDEADIVITSVLVDESVQLPEEELKTELAAEVKEVLVANHEDELDAFRVTVWSAPNELRQEAEANGLSTGKMAFYLKAKADGAEVKLEDLKEQSIHTIAKQFEEKRILAPDEKFTKEEMKRLLEEEKAKEKEQKKAAGEMKDKKVTKDNKDSKNGQKDKVKDKEDKEKDKNKDKDKDKDKDNNKDKDKKENGKKTSEFKGSDDLDKNKDEVTDKKAVKEDRDKEKTAENEKEMAKDRNKGKNEEKDKELDKEKNKDKEDRNVSKNTDNNKEKTNGKDRGSDKNKDKNKEKNNGNGQDNGNK
jgi:hypothetical protein